MKNLKLLKVLLSIFFVVTLLVFIQRNVLAQQSPVCGTLSVSPNPIKAGDTVTFSFSVSDSSEFNAQFSIGVFNIEGGRITGFPITLSGSGHFEVALEFPFEGQFVIIATRGTELPSHYESDLTCSIASLTVSSEDSAAPVPAQGGSETGKTSEDVSKGCPGENYVSTAIGCVPLGDIEQITRFFLGWAVGIAGGIALLLIGLAAYGIMTSQGDPRRLQGAQELLLSAIGGLIMIILSIYLLRFIGVDLLGLFKF